jgi:hypothetical protein
MKVDIELERYEFDALEAVFPPGSVVPDVDDIAGEAVDVATAFMLSVAERRMALAITGAMRWPWSQEAVLQYRLELRYQ